MFSKLYYMFATCSGNGINYGALAEFAFSTDKKRKESVAAEVAPEDGKRRRRRTNSNTSNSHTAVPVTATAAAAPVVTERNTVEALLAKHDYTNETHIGKKVSQYILSKDMSKTQLNSLNQSTSKTTLAFFAAGSLLVYQAFCSMLPTSFFPSSAPLLFNKLISLIVVGHSSL